MNIVRILDELSSKRAERLRLTNKAKILEQEEKNLQAELAAQGATSGQYGNFLLTAKSKTVPKCDDWAAFHQYVLATGNLEMLHKRLTETAVMEHLNDGERIPGISTDVKTTYDLKDI